MTVRKAMLAFLLSSVALVAVASEPARYVHNWQKVDLREIKVRGEIGRRVDLTIYGNLLKMEIEKQFLEHFREKKRDDDSVGTGKLVEYAVRFAAYTRDPKVLALKNYVVDELLKTQDDDGYIGCLCKSARLWGYWDLAETGFIILGLSADHRYFGEKRSLAAAERAAQFIIDNWKTMPEGWETAWISGTAAAVGLCWGMEALYRETGDHRYLDFCTRERKLDTWYAPITIGRGFGIHGHSATHLYQCIVQLELLGHPTPALRRAADETAAFMLDGDGSLISGACGLWECWSNDQCGRPSSGETCSTAFQLRLWDLLVQCSDTPSARWGDALERTMYNALFAAQSKDGRQMRYYAPLEGRRIYWPRDTYCCPNNFRRIMSELPEYLFYKSGDVLFANLYSECDLETELAGAKVKVEERTAYPSDGRVEFTLNPGKPRTFGFAVRVPGWCESPALVADGERVEVRPGTVATVRREWKPGSKVVLELPMRLRVVAGRQRQSGRAAFLRGPVLYALNPVLNGGGDASEAETKSHERTAEEQKAANLRKFFAKDPADYCGEMIVDAATAKVVSDDSARPGGTAVEVRAATVGHAVGVTDQNGSTIRLTEYPDCDANATYFRILDSAVAEPDPLFTGAALASDKGAEPPEAIRAMMLKLGSNTHAEPLYPSEKPKNQWDYEHTVVDELRLDEDVWREVTQAMADKGYNMVVIGLAEGVVYPSHPELAVKGTWSVEKLKAELKRLRAMGLEPIPKMNFAASHDTWLGEYHRMVSTKKYYEVCADLIRDVVEMFDHPRLLHLGYDEEMPIAQEKSAYMVVRQGELWWHDFDFFRREVEKHGVRAWIWSDYFWKHPKEFLARMPKSVLQSNWYYRHDFSDKRVDRAQMEERIMASLWPEPSAAPSTYVEFEKAGYDQLPCGSVWANDDCMAATVRFCRERISKSRLKGFLMAPWLATLKTNREQLLFAVETGAKAFAADPQPPEVVWVENGVCKMPIVASGDERTQQAAKYLADRVEQMTGARPEIKSEWSGRAIRLETTAKPGDEAFRVVSKYGGVFMTGAAYNAAHAFAERVLGAKTSRLTIPAQDFQGSNQ